MTVWRGTLAALWVAFLFSAGLAYAEQITVTPGGGSSIYGIRNAAMFPGADIGTQINNALADFGASPACGTVIIPAGSYNLSTQVTTGARVGCVVEGVGNGATNILCVGLAVPAFTAAIAAGQSNYITYKSFALNNSGGPPCTSDAFYFLDTWYGIIDDVLVNGFSTSGTGGIHLAGDNVSGQNIAMWAIRGNTFITGGYHGLLIDGNGGGAVISTAPSVRIQNNAGYGVYVNTTACLQDGIIYGNMEGNVLGGVRGDCMYGGEIVIHFESAGSGPTATPVVLGPSNPSVGVRIGGDLHVTSANYCVSLNSATQITVTAACSGAVQNPPVFADPTSTNVLYNDTSSILLFGTKDSPQASHPGLIIADQTAAAQGVGGGIAFRGNGNGAMTTAGSIQSCKTSATSSDIGFDMCFFVRQNATGTNDEAGRILSTSLLFRSMNGFAVANVAAGGSVPALSGSCVVVAGTQTGGNTVGKFAIPAGACATTTTVILTFAAAAPTGYVCDAHDLTTPTSIFDQTGVESTTTATFTIRAVNAAAADIVKFKCMAY